MLNSKFHSFPFHSFPKENSAGTGGNFEYFHPSSLIPKTSGTGGNEWERVGTGELSSQPKAGMFSHWLDSADKKPRRNERRRAREEKRRQRGSP